VDTAGVKASPRCEYEGLIYIGDSNVTERGNLLVRRPAC